MTGCDRTHSATLVEHSNNSFCRRDLYPDAASITEILRRRAATQASEIAFVYLTSGEEEDAVRTYSDLDFRARAVASFLKESPWVSETNGPCRVILAYPPGADFADAFFGVLYAGLTGVNAFVPTNEREAIKLKAIAGDCLASVVLTHSSSLEVVRSTLTAAGVDEARIIATDGLPPASAEGSGYSADTRRNEHCFIQYTSGSTSTPKGIRVSHANLIHNLNIIERHMEGSKGDRYVGLGWLPVFHDMGLIACLNYPIFIGRPNVLFSHQEFAQRPHLWMSRIAEFGATHTAGPNFAFELSARLARRVDKATLDLSTLKVALCGAEPIQAATLERFVSAYADCGLNPRVLAPAYGLAEATLMVTGTRAGVGPRFLEINRGALQANLAENVRVSKAALSSDHPLPAIRRLVASGEVNEVQSLRIVDPEKLVELGNRSIGEIWISSASVADGHFNMSAENENQFAAYTADGSGPFLRTGDLGFVDDSHLYVTGRLKEVIILNGANHHPSDIEAAIKNFEIAQIRRSVAFAVNDMADRETVTILCELKSSISYADMEALTLKLASQLARSEGFSPGRIALVPKSSIPRTSSGKMQRLLARKQFANGSIKSIFEYNSIRNSLN